MTIPAPVEIVDFEPGLAAAFRELNAEWLDRSFGIEPIDEQMLGDPQGKIIESGGKIVFARLDGEIVGTAALQHHGDGVYELTKMAVTAHSQGRGIGRRLLDACIERFENSGGRRLYLESHSSLGPALKLYQSAGFRDRPRPFPSHYRRADVYMVYGGV